MVLVNAYVIADGEDNLAYLFLGAVLVVLFVFVQANGDVDASFGRPGLESC